MAKFNVNLSEGLTEDMFQVHEEILDEKALFQFHVLCDKIMNDNPKAKHDGGFKIKLPDCLRGTGSPLKEFWEKFDNGSQYLSSLHLTGDKDFPGVLKLHARRVPVHHSVEFKKAAKDPKTFDTTHRNCCMQALDEGGAKAAVIHFYDSLYSKAILKDMKATKRRTSSKFNYHERQLMLIEDDWPLTCRQIERSMKDKKYKVQNISASSTIAGGPPIDEDMPFPHSFVPIDVKQDGEGKNCSLYFNGIEETSDNFLYVTSNFGLAHLCHLNMLTDIPEYFSGIAYPFIYLGGLHSVFPIHIEDMSLWSINFNHLGYPKLIILIAPSEVSRLSLLLTTYGLSGTGKHCVQQLFHKSDLVFPQWLLEHNIKFKVVIQHPGEFIVFAPNAAHTGGNMGPNLAEACNFGSHDWLPFGSVASHGRCNCIESGVHFDVTQLILDHRKELLLYHLNKSMWTSFKDDHFAQCLIIPSSACFSSFDVTPSTKPTTSTSVRIPYKSEKQQRQICPVKGCGKEFKCGSKAVVTHIKQIHSDCVKDSAVEKYLSQEKL